MWAAHDAARAMGLKNVYVYDDKGCDCAKENLPIATYCGEEGVLLKKYETLAG